MLHLSLRSRPAVYAVVAFALLAVAIAGIMTYIGSPPRIARLLPEADAIVYADLRPARLATHFDRTAPARSPEFQAFVDATGIVPERDLDEVAFALTRRADPSGPNGPVAYTEIFHGHFDQARLARYLAQNATAQESYASRTLYALPSGEPGSPQPRVLRLAILEKGLLAVSNAPTAEQMHAIIDHERLGFFGRSSPSLLADRFREVPSLSEAWGLGSLGLPFAESGHVALLGFNLPLPADQPMIASVRYLGVLRLRVAAIAPTPELAMQQTGALTGLLGLIRTLSAGSSATPPQLAALANSVSVVQIGAETVITADIPVELLRQLIATH